MEPLFITRRCILTLDGGCKLQATLTIPRPRKFMRPEQMERYFIREFNKAQPHAVHKVVACHIMRN